MGKVLCFSYDANLSNLKDLRFTTSCKMIFSVDVILFLQIIINEKWLNKRMHIFLLWQINKNRYGWAQIQVYFHSFVKKTPKVSLCNTEIIPRFDCHSSIVLFGPWKYLQILQDVKSIQNHFWIKGITILNLSFCNDMMKNERLCYALKKEIWFLENAIVINVRKLFGVFRFLKRNISK